MQGSSLEFNYQGSRIEKQGYNVKLFLFSKRTMLYSHIAVQLFIPSISACSAVFCNCLNCLLRRAFNRCKSIFSVSKIPPACTVCVAYAHHVPRFSQMNGAARISFCELSLSLFDANHDEGYDI